MIVAKNKIYPPSYRPGIYLANVTIKYFNKKYLPRAKKNISDVKKHIKTIQATKVPVILNDDNQIPNQFMHKRTIKQTWKHSKTNDNITKNFPWIDKIEIIDSMGKTTYPI